MTRFYRWSCKHEFRNDYGKLYCNKCNIYKVNIKEHDLFRSSMNGYEYRKRLLVGARRYAQNTSRSIQDLMGLDMNNKKWLFYVSNAPCLATVHPGNNNIEKIEKKKYNWTHMWDWCLSRGEQGIRIQTSKSAYEWLNYLANESPFKELFYIKDAKKMMEYGIIYDVHQPSFLFLEGASGARYCYEFTDMVDTWWKMVNSGVDKDLAMILMHFYKVCENDQWVRQTHDSGHSMFRVTTLTVGHVKNMLDRKQIDVRFSFYENGPLTPSLNLWGKPTGKKIVTICDQLNMKKVWKGRDDFGYDIWNYVEKSPENIVNNLKEVLNYE